MYVLIYIIFYCRWNDFESNISTSFRELREDSEFFDVTLCCDNGTDIVPAHKVILAACSPLFRKILSRQKNQQNPFLYLKAGKGLTVKKNLFQTTNGNSNGTSIKTIIRTSPRKTEVDNTSVKLTITLPTKDNKGPKKK